jgi:hypothetical protein
MHREVEGDGRSGANRYDADARSRSTSDRGWRRWRGRIRGIDVERCAAGELNRVFSLKIVQLLEECLPDIGNGHLTLNSDFHSNILI